MRRYCKGDSGTGGKTQGYPIDLDHECGSADRRELGTFLPVISEGTIKELLSQIRSSVG